MACLLQHDTAQKKVQHAHEFKCVCMVPANNRSAAAVLQHAGCRCSRCRRKSIPPAHRQHPCCSGHCCGWSVGPWLLLDLCGHAPVIVYRASSLGAAAVAIGRSTADARSTAAVAAGFAGRCRRCRRRLLLHAGCDGPCSTASCLCCLADPVILERLLLGAAAPREAALQTLKPAPTQHGTAQQRPSGPACWPYCLREQLTVHRLAQYKL